MNSYWILWYLSRLSVAHQEVVLHEESEIEMEKPAPVVENDDPLIINTQNSRQTGRPTRHQPKRRQQIPAPTFGVQSYEAVRTAKHQQRGRGKWQ